MIQQAFAVAPDQRHPGRGAGGGGSTTGRAPAGEIFVLEGHRTSRPRSRDTASRWSAGGRSRTASSTSLRIRRPCCGCTGWRLGDPPRRRLPAHRHGHRQRGRHRRRSARAGCVITDIKGNQLRLRIQAGSGTVIQEMWDPDAASLGRQVHPALEVLMRLDRITTDQRGLFAARAAGRAADSRLRRARHREPVLARPAHQRLRATTTRCCPRRPAARWSPSRRCRSDDAALADSGGTAAAVDRARKGFDVRYTVQDFAVADLESAVQRRRGRLRARPFRPTSSRSRSGCDRPRGSSRGGASSWRPRLKIQG